MPIINAVLSAVSELIRTGLVFVFVYENRKEDE